MLLQLQGERLQNHLQGLTSHRTITPVHLGRRNGLHCRVGGCFLCSLPEVFTPCSPPSIQQGSDSNEVFLEGLRALLKKANCKLTICSEVETRSDRWIQVISQCLSDHTRLPWSLQVPGPCGVSPAVTGTPGRD